MDHVGEKLQTNLVREDRQWPRSANPERCCSPEAQMPNWEVPQAQRQEVSNKDMFSAVIRP